MRILLTANASYHPPKGGSTRSNLIWLEHLAHAGHVTRVVAPGEKTTIVNGVEICGVPELSRRAHILSDHIRDFHPDWVLVSSEDVAHTLLREAFEAAPDRLIYLAHTPQWYPFGPASWHPDNHATEIIRQARGVVAIGKTTARYIEQYGGAKATVIHPPIYGTAPWPRFGSPDRGYVLMINPSVVKGIGIFLELAKRFPEVEFAGLTGWGTTTQDRQAMAALPNMRILDPVPDIDDALAGARVLLMPSLWFEGFGLIAMEAMLRGLPVLSSDAGGLVEARQNTGYIVPVRPIEHFLAEFDETHMPRPVEVEQNIEPWVEALGTLLTDHAEYRRQADLSREVAERFVNGLQAADFEAFLQNLKKLRVLLAHNSLYYPSHGGGDKSNRLLMEALAERGHDVRVVARVERFGAEAHDKLLRELASRKVKARTEDGAVRFEHNGVDVHTVALDPNLRGYFAKQIADFDPDVIITSTDDPGQLLFDVAVRASRARVVYLVRATIAVPFGRDSSSPNSAKTELLRHADAVVGVSEYVARYVREQGGMDAVHVPISLPDTGPEPPNLGRFDNPYVMMANPSAVKGIDIFLALCDQMPGTKFAAVPTWGTTAEDRASLAVRPNVTLLDPVDNIDDVLRLAKVLLVPSVWAEARSRIVVEAMARGVPVISSDAGGLPEAHMGVEYTIPVRLIERYRPSLDSNMVPIAEVPLQNIEPWQGALQRLLTDEQHWQYVSNRSRDAALDYTRSISVEPFERILAGLLTKPKKVASVTGLSEDKRKLLTLRLRQKAASGNPWLSRQPATGERALFCFPWAGGGTLGYRGWPAVAICLPGRETRIVEQPFESMEDLIPALGEALLPVLRGREFAFFGHSMGAGVAFELTRWLRDRDEPLPYTLIVSAARAPRFRIDYEPAPEPSDEVLLQRLHIPKEIRENPAALNLLMPALRADTRLYRNWTYHPTSPLAVPIYAYGGADDPNVRPEHLEEWRHETNSLFLRRAFPGGHFYLNQQVIRSVESDLKAAVPLAGR